MKYSVLVLYRAMPDWLRLSREDRSLFFQRKIVPIIEKFDQKLKVRLFDSEAFHAITSDYMQIECADLQDYYYFIEYLRDTELFSQSYIELNDVIIGIENGFKQFEEEHYSK